jgi:hypothetical protein
MIKKIVTMQVIATMIAAKILGRAIDAVKRGFAEDPELPAQLNVYRAIQDMYPDTTVSVKEMYDSMVSRAEGREKKAAANVKGLTAEQQKLWSGGDGSKKESELLLASIPAVLDLLVAATPTLDAWKEMPVIGQWAILSSVERSLPEKASFYRGKGGTNFLGLADQIDTASPVYFKCITEYLAQKGVSAALDLAKESGINVPERSSVAA